MFHGKWSWLPFGVLTVGIMIAGRRVRWFILAALVCLALFVAGTETVTDPMTGAGTWHLTLLSWLGILGFIVSLCVYPWALRHDVRDKAKARVESDVQRAEYSMLVQQEAASRLPPVPDLTKFVREVPPSEPKHVAPRFEYETDSGLIVRDHRAVDPDEL